MLCKILISNVGYVMKIAICLYGSSGYETKLLNEDLDRMPLGLDIPLRSLITNIKEPNKADIHVHSWSKEVENKINEILEPKSTLFEDHKTFDKHNKFRNAVKSRFYSQNMSSVLMRDYENQYNLKYDFVLTCRLDLIWFKPFSFNNLNVNKFYASNWNISQPNLDAKIDNSNDHNNLGPFDKSNFNKGVAFMDHWFLSNSDNIFNFTNMSRNLIKLNAINWIHNFKARKLVKNKNSYNPHHLTFLQAKKLNFEIEYIKFRGEDYDLYRRYINPFYFKN